MDSINNFSVDKLINNDYVIKKKDVSWDEILFNKEIFYDEIVSILLNEESLYFYCTSNNDSKILYSNLSENQRKRIKNIFELLIKKPESFYKEYNKGISLIEELKKIIDYGDLDKFLKKYGIKYELKKINISKDKANITKKIKKESSYGLFGELMLYSVVHNLLNNKDILISKLSFITAPGTYPQGSDGIFIDIENKTLYFGEAKFTLDLKSAFEQALSSLKELEERIKIDNDIIYCHESDMKNNFSLKTFENEEIENFKKCIIIFALNGREYIEEEIKEIVKVYESKFSAIFGEGINFEILIFPIIDKEELKNQIAKQVSIDYENNR